MKYTPIIGLEIHVELNTKTKMFCRCSADHFGKEVNTQTCPVCLGLPGALPYTNRAAIESCIKIGLALNCKINLDSFFERKNYFYPDLPKGFQVSQYLHPFGHGGHLDIKANAETKRIRITRVHMEEDTGKNTHTTLNGEKVSLLDFNRSGVPLVEIVTEPDIHSGEDAKVFLTELQKIVRYLGVSDADMEKGNMRLEPNISLQREGEDNLPQYKVEVKNINSFRFVERAIDFETKRQKVLLNQGKTPKQETRGWNENKNETVSQRSKEEAHDYRYFPEPDIPPIHFEESETEKLKLQIPELPIQKTERYVSEYELLYYDAEILTREKRTADYFENAVGAGKAYNVTPKQIANYIINKKISVTDTVPAELVKQIKKTQQKTQVDEKELEEIVKKLLEENQEVVKDYKAGKTQVIGFLIGKTKRLVPYADATQVKTAIERLI